MVRFPRLAHTATDPPRVRAVSAELDGLSDWIGRTETREDIIAVDRVAAMAATMDQEQAPGPGDALPPGWHWLFFNPAVRAAEIGPDGHPKRGGFLPPVPLPRRMWAGGRLTFHAPLQVGEVARRDSEIVNVEAKSGRSGALVFVTVRHRAERGRRSGDRGGARHRLPALAGPGRRDAHAAAGPDGRGLAPRDPARPGAAVPLLGADLQRPPHPLRPPLCDPGGGLSRPDRARPPDRHISVGSCAPGAAGALRQFAFRAISPLFETAPFSVQGVPAGDGLSARLWATGPGWRAGDERGRGPGREISK